jgi:hypothetical protein
MKRRAIVLSAILLGFALLSFAQAPVPFINLPLVPDAAPPGGPQFTLTVNGTGFVSNSVVNWNGTPLATQFVSQGQLTATVPASNIATASTGWVTVVNPTPGGGTSSTAYFSVATTTPGYIAFNLYSSPPVNGGPSAMAVGDFNGDGKLDLAVTEYFQASVSILLGDGAGNFNLASSPGVGTWPDQIAVGDFNGDGKLDLAVANSSSNSVSILLGDGTGNFIPGQTLSGLTYPSVAVGDFNGDGKLDLAITDTASNTVSIFLGDGTGNFNLTSNPFTGYVPISVAVGDFNGDGKLDLAVANACGSDPNCESPSTVSTLLGDGTGNFTLASSTSDGNGKWNLLVGDFNGDGKLDLAVEGEETTTILAGDGTGNFNVVSTINFGVDWDVSSLALGDLDGDGNLDLAITQYNSNIVPVLLGNGAGNFNLVSSPPTGSGPWPVAIGDFNGDGKPDLAVGNYYFLGPISVLLQVTPSPTVTLSPPSLRFASQLVGTPSNPQDVTLSNTGSAPLLVTKIVASANFAQKNNCPPSLAPGANCTIGVVFEPRRVGTITGTITITDNAGNSPQVVPLTGAGSWVSLLPPSLNFGDQKKGTSSPPQIVTFTNHDPKTVTIYRGGIVGSQAGSFDQTNDCLRNIPPGGTCTISVVFTPKHAGPQHATLGVDDNGGGSPQTVALSGNGTH